MRNSIKQREAVRNYMKNRVVSKETRLKISLSKKGIKAWNKGLTKDDPRVAKYTEAKIGRSRPDMAKENNPAWNGGVTAQNKLDRSKFGQTMQKQIFERDNYTCQLCGARGNLQVDHIQSWKDYIELRFEMSNCRTLCQDCHYKITYGKPKPKDVKAWGHNFKYYERRVKP